jgi:hypothetical protein
MLDYAEPVTKLIDEFKRLPGVGQKSAQRLAFHILRMPEQDVARFVAAMEEVKRKIVFCTVCNNLTDVDPCRYCSSTSRDRSIICVVEEPYNLVAVEKTRSYHGLYHILHRRRSHRQLHQPPLETARRPRHAHRDGDARRQRPRIRRRGDDGQGHGEPPRDVGSFRLAHKSRTRAHISRMAYRTRWVRKV